MVLSHAQTANLRRKLTLKKLKINIACKKNGSKYGDIYLL